MIRLHREAAMCESCEKSVVAPKTQKKIIVCSPVITGSTAKPKFER